MLERVLVFFFYNSAGACEREEEVPRECPRVAVRLARLVRGLPRPKGTEEAQWGTVLFVCLQTRDSMGSRSPARLILKRGAIRYSRTLWFEMSEKCVSFSLP